MFGAIGSGTMSKNIEKTSLEKYVNGKIIFETQAADRDRQRNGAAAWRQMCVNPKGQHDNNLAQIPMAVAAAAAGTKDGRSTNEGRKRM